jgi:diguanylate cyclase (GGDEF)-like protein
MQAAGAVHWGKNIIGRPAAGLLAFLLAIAWALPAAGSEPWVPLAQTAFQQLGVPEGLPNIVVFSTAQDPDGFLWFGTGDGLGRWDGYRFRVFRPDPRAPDSLPDNFIQVLHIDGHGRLWVGSASGGLVRYDSTHENFVRYGIEGRDSGRIEIRAICDDGAGGLWVGGGAGLYRLRAGATSLRHVANPVPSEPTALAGERVVSLLRDRNGVLWFGTGRGLYRQEGAGEHFAPVKLTENPQAVAALRQDASGTVWAGTNGAGVFLISADGKTVLPVPRANPAAQPPPQSLDVEAMVEARPGEMWLGTSGEGIVAIDETSFATRHMRHDATRSSSLAEDTVGDLFKDRGGLVWVGTAHGVSWTNPAADGIQTVFSAPGRPNAISDADVGHVFVAPNNSIWLGLVHDGVNIIDPGFAQVTRLPPHGDFPATIVTALADGPRQPGGPGVFIGTWRGLFHADATGGNLVRVPMPAPTPERAVLSLARDGNTLWIGHTAGLDRLMLDVGPGAPQAVQHALAGARLSDSRVRVILPDSTGKLWIGTFDGVNLFDPATGQVMQARPDPAISNGMPNGLVTSLLLDRKKRLWVATTSGIYRLKNDPARGPLQFQHLGTEDGLPNASVDELLQAPDGQIWASTDDGLAKIDPDTLRVTAFHEPDGLAIPSYWDGSGAMTQTGTLLFGGAGGLTLVRPDKLAPSPALAHLVLSELRIGGQKVPVAPFNQPGGTRTLTIAPQANSLSVEFSALDYASAARTHYAYKLSGFDQDWIATDPSRRLATYNNLPAGQYVLRLRAESAAGGAAAATLNIPIIVRPAWFETIWCRCAAAVLSVAAILLVIRLQTIRLRQRQHELELQIAKRTAELRASNRDLAHAASVLSDLGVIGQQITANLDTDTVFAIVHEHIARLLDAPYCAIYLLQKLSRAPVLRFARWNGLGLDAAGSEIAKYETHVLSAIAERQEIIVVPSQGPSLLCAPLVAVDRVIGVMLIRSPRAQAYVEQDRLIFRTLCAYAAIALGNAETLVALADMRVQLEHLAYTDLLTDLPNRRAYTEQLERIAARCTETGEQCALLLIDIDRFKHINDNFGHDAGDALLAETARLLCGAVRARDLVSRLGGDEFAIILCDVKTPEDVENTCDRIAAQFLAGIRFQEAIIDASVSIGVALFPTDGATEELLYKAADMALYEAKRAGRNTWRRFVPADRMVLRRVRAE